MRSLRLSLSLVTGSIFVAGFQNCGNVNFSPAPVAIELGKTAPVPTPTPDTVHIPPIGPALPPPDEEPDFDENGQPIKLQCSSRNLIDLAYLDKIDSTLTSADDYFSASPAPYAQLELAHKRNIKLSGHSIQERLSVAYSVEASFENLIGAPRTGEAAPIVQLASHQMLGLNEAKNFQHLQLTASTFREMRGLRSIQNFSLATRRIGPPEAEYRSVVSGLTAGSYCFSAQDINGWLNAFFESNLKVIGRTDGPRKPRLVKLYDMHKMQTIIVRNFEIKRFLDLETNVLLVKDSTVESIEVVSAKKIIFINSKIGLLQNVGAEKIYLINSTVGQMSGVYGEIIKK